MLEKLAKTLLLGTASGIINAIMMLFMDIGWQAVVAAFLHWISISIILTYGRFSMPGWFSGIFIGVLTTLPLAFVSSITDPKAWMAQFFSAVFLGCALGYTTQRLITDKRNR